MQFSGKDRKLGPLWSGPRYGSDIIFFYSIVHVLSSLFALRAWCKIELIYLYNCIMAVMSLIYSKPETST